MGSIVLSVFISLIGMAVFAYGKRTARMVPLSGGIVLMVYPYFVPNALAMALIGLGLIIGMIVLWDALD